MAHKRHMSADLELSLRRWGGEGYALEARFQLSASAAPAQLIAGAPPRIHLDVAALTALALDPAAYGAALGRFFFADPRVGAALAKARAQAESLAAPLRLRLRLAADDDELHALRWETLQAPDSPDPLARSERTLFARHLDSADMTPLQIGPRVALRALVVVAGPPPAELARYGLAPVDVPAELARARAALGALPTSVVASGQGPGATLDALVAALRDGPEIVVIVAHGTLRRGRPYLWLDDGAGGAERVEGVELVEAVARLPRRPLLALLLACQGAGDGVGAALAGIGPQLAAAGVAAVIAMQGNLSIASAARLLPAFFAELWRDGQVDRAMAAARLALRDSGDWWQPALFLRVPDGRLWLDEAPAAPDAPAGPAIPPPPQPERPPELAGFVGRATELAALSAALGRDGMVLLTGMPGVGKTSVAAALASQVGDPDSTFWHSFRPGEGAESLIWALAGFLAQQGRAGLWELLQQARLGGGQPPPLNVQIDYVVQLLEAAGGLLCLDDFQLVDDDPQLAPFVERLVPLLRAGRLRLIVTSRRVPDFALIEHVELLTGLGAGDAALLLAGRGVVLDDALQAELYAQVGGNAQLLTLAADALRRTADPARLIRTLTEADSIERYLLDEIDATLSAEERGTMKPVAALLEPGGTRGAIEALADGANVRRPLRSLSDRYLLLTQEAAAGKEYHQHAIVQRFYYEELGRRERAELHRRASAYYETEEPDPLRAALHAFHAGEPGRAAELLGDDVYAFVGRGQSRPLLALLEQIAARQRAAPPDAAPLPPMRWVRVLRDLGTLQKRAGASEASAAYFQEALTALETLPESTERIEAEVEICRELADLLLRSAPNEALLWVERGLRAAPDPGPITGWLLIMKGAVLMNQGRLAEAEASIRHGLEQIGLQHPVAQLDGLITLSAVLIFEGRAAEAITIITAATDQYRQAYLRASTPKMLISLLMNLAIAQDMVGEWPAARVAYAEAAQLAAAIGSLRHRADLTNNLGWLAMKAGDDDAALAHFQEGLAIATKAGLRNLQATARSNLADLHLRRGDLDAAAPELDAAEALAESLGNAYVRQEAARHRASLALQRGAPVEALALAGRALELARALGSPAEEGQARRVMAHAHAANADLAAALAEFAAGAALLAEDPYELARTRAAWGAALRTPDPEQGRALLEQARATFARLGARRDLAGVQ